MKRVLIVTADFPPQGGTGTIRVTKFVKYLQQFGWQATVVCTDATWNRDDSLTRDVPAGMCVHRVAWPGLMRAFSRPGAAPRAASAATPATVTRSAGLKARAIRVARRLLIPDVNVVWTWAAARACSRLARQQPFDAILTTSPPHSIHLAGWWVRTRMGLPWVADFRDVWTAENLALRRQGRLHFAAQRRIEKRMLASCDRAVMNTEPLRRRALAVFGSTLAPKMVTITNGYDPADFDGAFIRNPARTRQRLTIAFVGSVLGPQVDNAFPDGLRRALEQSEAFRASGLVRFVGSLDPAYRARFEGLEANVEFRDFVPHGEAVDAMREADVLLMLLPNTDLARMTFTNKFFEYLAARRPLLALVPPGIISQIVEDERIGLVAPPDDAEAIARAILTIFESVQARPDGYDASQELLARFDRKVLTGQLAAVLTQASQVHHARR